MSQEKHSKAYGTLIDRTLRLIKLQFIQAFKKAGIDLTPEQWVVIDELYQRNGISQTDLANGSFKNAPTVSRIIDLLVKKNMVERQRFENDRRRYKIYLTPKGKETFEIANPIAQEVRLRGWEGLSEEDYEHFERVMNQVFSNFDKP
jgi:DNA-binding MarR family transcriptional regulator